MRFEKSFYDKLDGIHYIGAKKANKCSNDTARMICATSWGLYQILGVNIYNRIGNWHYGGIITKFVHNVILQHQCFTEFVSSKGIDYSVEQLITDATCRSKFARIYNGPGNIDEYSRRIVKYAEKLKIDA